MEYYSYSRISNENRKFPIHNALLKYGYSGFKLEILEFCDQYSLIVREQYYIDSLNPDYNVLSVAGSSLGFKHSEATKELFRKTRLGIKKARSLDKKSVSTFSCSNIRPVSDKKRLNLSNNSYKAIPVTLTNVETKVSTTFVSKNKAAAFLNVSEATVRKYLLEGRTCNGYIIMLKPLA
jgi:group I intron endonuclease